MSDISQATKYFSREPLNNNRDYLRWALEFFQEFLAGNIVVEGKLDSAILAELAQKTEPTDTQYVKLRIMKDGSLADVVLDTVAPYANTPIPVVLTDILGNAVVSVDVNGDLEVNIEHDGLSPSSVRIGDGTTLAGVTLTNDLKTYDSAIDTKIGTIGAASDVDGYITQQLRYIGEAIAALTGTPASTIATISNTNVSNVTATQISGTSHACKYVIVQAPETNTSWIRIGGSDLTTTTGTILYPTDNIRLDINNSNLLYAIAGVNGEDIVVTYFN